MGLLNLTTNLKSLKYGKDRPGGGDSKQPYIQKPVPSSEDSTVPNSPDFILRGGLQAPARAASDLLRLGKYFTDLRTPNGILFTAKQNLLSRISVATEASINASYGNNAFKGELGWTKAALNQGIYTPISTLLQSVNGFVGNHLNTFGLDPFTPNQNTMEGGLFPSLGLIRYEDVVRGQTNLTKKIKGEKKVIKIEKYETRDSFIGAVYKGKREVITHVEANVKVPLGENANRLIYLYSEHTIKTNLSPIILEYNGGPGSVLGIGKTKIKFADQRTGENHPKYIKSDKSFFIGGYKNSPRDKDDKDVKIEKVLGLSISEKRIKDNLSLKPLIGSLTGSSYTGYSGDELFVQDSIVKDRTENKNEPWFTKGGLGNSTTPRDNNAITLNLLGVSKRSEQSQFKYKDIEDNLTLPKYSGYNESFQEINEPTSSRVPTTLKDFRAKEENGIVDIYKDASKILEGDNGSRINLRSPGRKLDNLDTKDVKLKNNFTTNTLAVDKINAYPIYKSKAGDDGNLSINSKDTNDLVKFRIGVIDGETKEYMHFRAFIDNFSDSYDGKWSSTNYMGRGESFYTYNGFDRSINLSFTVAAQSRAELIPQYQKLNFLASTLAPKYSDSGYMGGQLVSLTMGGWLYEQVGFISSLTLDVPQESPWEIGIDNEGNYSEDVKDKDYNKTVKELPHIVKVSGFKFTPIHNFRPEVMKNSYGGTGDIVDKYGDQRFIALKAYSNSWDYIPEKP